MASLKVWLRASQAQSFIVSVVPVLIGAAVAANVGASLSVPLLLLTILGVLCIHAATNMSNDYIDFKTGVDNQPPEIISPFTAGSRVLPEKLVTAEAHRRVWVALYAVGAAVGAYLAYTVPGGWVILLLGASMGLLSFFYTYPPLKLQYHGLGEALVGVIFGPVLAFGAFYVQAARFDWQPLIVSVPFGLFVAAFLLVNEMPEWQTDPKGGKVTVPARVGLKASMRIYAVLMVSGYVWLVGAVAMRLLPLPALLGLLSLPLAVRAISILRRHYAEFPKHLPANAATLLCVLLSGIGLLAGYAVPLFVHF
jgi:1,4-dihydroxy-2-naphthoate octaprenyltransferase